jgi:hypothetical protein
MVKNLVHLSNMLTIAKHILYCYTKILIIGNYSLSAMLVGTPRTNYNNEKMGKRKNGLGLI